MQKFKIAASQSNKKYNLILAAESESEARERVHKEWYSILSIALYDEKEITGTKFIFHIISGEAEKKWVIVWEDIFKSYVKLRRDLWYDVKYLYPKEEEDILDNEKKARIMHDLKQWYDLKINTQKKKEPKKKKVVDAKEVQKIDKSFYLKKELEETHELIEKVLVKLEPIITEQKKYSLSPERILKLKNIYNSIVKIKKSTNISKLKEIGEVALLKIWDIELESLEKQKDSASKDLLWETNKLLKEIGSGKQFKEKDKDIVYILSSFFKNFQKSAKSSLDVKSFFSADKKDKLIDKESYWYLKTLLLLERYTQKKRDNTKKMYKNILAILLPFGKNIETRDKILIKRKVINQNISLLKAKKSGSVGSYTTVVKWYKALLEAIGELFSNFARVLFFVVLFYVCFFVAYLTLVRLGYDFWNFTFNYKGIMYFLFVVLLVVLGSVSRGVIMFCINVVFLSFILIFSVVNF